MNVSIDDLLDEIDDEIDKAWSLPLTGGKRAISADWLREKIDDVRANMPSEVRQAKNIVADRAEIISTARREAEAIIRKAEERARRMMSEEEVQKAVCEIIESVDIPQLNVGAVMKVVMPKLKGKADMKEVSTLIKEILMSLK